MTELVWAIKESLLAYVRGAADGYVDVVDGAVEQPEGFVFPAVSEAEAGESMRFRGRVVLTGHRGMLYLEFAEPAIERGVAGAVLTIADDEGGRIAFAALDDIPAPGSAVRARLTADGAELMLGNYREGDELAPVALALGHEGRSFTKGARS